MKKIFLFIIIFCSLDSFSQEIQAKEATINLQIDLRISKLQKENDSLKKIVSKILIEDYKSTEVIDKVNNYYDNAWTKLIYMLSVIGGIMVVVLPIFLTIQQKNELKTNKLNFQEDVDKKIQELETKILAFNKQEIENVRVEMSSMHQSINDRQERDIERLYAMTYFLQGIYAISMKDTDLVIKSFIISIQSLINVKTMTNLSQCLGYLEKGLSQKIDDKKKLDKSYIEEVRNIISDVKEMFPEKFNETLNSIENKINELE